jgi:hypothetical protein
LADQRITQLTALPSAGVSATDVLPIADVSASQTKKITVQDLADASLDLAGAGSIDLDKLDQTSVTKLGTTALADDAITAAKLANDSSIAVDTILPGGNNFEGRGYFNSSSGNLQVYNGSTYQQVVMPTAGIGDLQVTTGKLAAGAVTTDKVTALGTAAYADSSVTTAKIADDAITADKIADTSVTAALLAADAVETVKIADNAVTYAKLQDSSATDVILGRASAGAGDIEEIACTAAGRALLDDADAAAQRTTLGLGTLATQNAGSVAITGGTATLSSASITSATISGGSVTGITDLAIADGGTGASTAADARTNLGLAIGTNVQAYDAGLASISNLATSANQYLYTTGSDTYATGSITAAGRALLDDADAAAQRETLGLGGLAVATGTWVNGSSFSGTSSGTNTGDQTITLTGDVTGSGTGSFATSIASSAITESKIATNAVTTAKINANAVTAAKLSDDSAAVVTAASPTGSGAFIGQQWFDTNTSVEYTWDGTDWIRQAGLNNITFVDSTPIAFAVTYPDAYTATVTTTLDTQGPAVVFAGPESGADAAPTFRSLVPGDLPNATASTKGIIQPGTGLSVTSGTLNHSNSATAGTYTKLTIDSVGHVTVGATLDAADIPELDTSKIISGTFGTSYLADDAVTGLKLADYSTAKVGETLPTADYIGQIFLNPLDKAFFMWDGNVWQPIGISAGSVIFAGTYDASTNLIATVTTEGTAIGLSVGNPLPAASNNNESYYVIVSESGTGASPAPAVALAPPDLILSNGTAWVEIDVSSTYVAQTAANVGFVPAANLGSTNVQAALEEVSNECRNADNITSGTLLATRGGTGFGAYTKGDLLAASSGTALSKLGVGTNGQVLRANSATATGLEWGTDYVGTVTSVTGSGAISVANGTTTPAISVAAATTSVVGVVQLSDSTSTTSSVLAATPTAVKAAYDLANAALPKAGGTVTGQVLIGTTGSLVFEGATNDEFETTLAVADPTADRTITLPNSTGTVALTAQLDDGTY